MSVAEAAKAVYESDYRAQMEAKNLGKFIAIEPESRECFVAETFIDAALQAKIKIPDKMSFVIKIGSDAAVHIGSASLSMVVSTNKNDR